MDSDSIILSDPELRKHFYFNACCVCFEKNDYDQSEKYYDALIDAADTPSAKMLSQMARLKVEKGYIAGARHMTRRAYIARGKMRPEI